MSTISASTTSTTAFKITTDTTGALVFQTGSSPTTALTLDTSQNATLVGNIRLNNGTADGAQLSLASSGYSDWNIDNYSGNFRWYYNATEYMRLDATGNLGLGVTPNAWLSNRRVLQIGGNTVAAVSHSATIGESLYNLYYNSGGSTLYQNTGPAAVVDFNNRAVGGFSWNIAASGTAGNAVTLTQAMTLTAGGVLGIATTSPWSSSVLDVNGNANFRNNTYVGVSTTSQAVVNKIFSYNDLAYNDAANTVVTDAGTVTTNAMRRLSSAPSNGWFYGPYYDLAPGNYVAKFRLKVANNASSSNILYIDCAGVNITTNPKGNSAKQLQPNLFAASNVYQYFDLYFTKTAAGGYLETRGLSFVTGITDMYLDHILIQPA